MALEKRKQEEIYMSSIQEVFQALGLALEEERRKYRMLASMSHETAKSVVSIHTSNTSEPKAEQNVEHAKLERNIK